MISEQFSIYLEPYQAVYIDIAKVASSSIKATLASVLELENANGNPHEVDFPRPPRADSNGAKVYPNLYTFAFVRNPWDRLVSCYRDKIGGEVPDFTGFADNGVAHCLARFDVFKSGMSFTDFAYAVASIPDEDADEHFRSQADYVTNSAGHVAVDFVGRYENLSNDFSKAASRIGLNPDLKLPRLQAASSRDFRRYYTPDIASLVASRYAKDVELFNYQFPSA